MENGSCYGFADDQTDLSLEENDCLNHSDAEVVSSLSYSEADLAHTVELLGEQGSLLDKIKAIQLHVLASEQWNASQLQLCHR